MFFKFEYTILCLLRFLISRVDSVRKLYVVCASRIKLFFRNISYFSTELRKIDEKHRKIEEINGKIGFQLNAFMFKISNKIIVQSSKIYRMLILAININVM